MMYECGVNLYNMKKFDYFEKSLMEIWDENTDYWSVRAYKGKETLVKEFFFPSKEERDAFWEKLKTMK